MTGIGRNHSAVRSGLMPRCCWKARLFINNRRLRLPKRSPSVPAVSRSAVNVTL